MSEKYKPSEEETKKADEMMTDEQKEISEEKEKEYKEKTTREILRKIIDIGFARLPEKKVDEGVKERWVKQLFEKTSEIPEEYRDDILGMVKKCISSNLLEEIEKI